MVVLAYIRVSTDEQAEKGNSLNEQKERIEAYCKAMGWEEPIFFIEDGYSAKSTNRPELTIMLEKVKEYQSGRVITTKLDRLSRKLFDILSLNNYFVKHKFHYVSATEGFDTSTPAGMLVLQMLGMVAEFERERNSERVRENMLSIARNNTKKIITRPCFGYDIVDGKMAMNLDEALCIRRAAMKLLTGTPSRSVIGEWNAQGITTKEGNEWQDKTFRELFQRETLVGDFVYNKTTRQGDKVIKNDPSLWIREKNTHEAILDRDTFTKLQELFQGRKSVGKHMSNDTYLLSGLVYCSHCGSKMNGKMNRSFSKRLNRENIHYQYLCDGYLKKGKCFHHYVQRDAIEELVISRIKEVAQAAPGTLKLVISKPQVKQVDKESIENKLAKLDKKMQKQIDAYNDDLITAEDLKAATLRVTKERDALKKILESSEEEQASRQQEELKRKARSATKAILSGDRITVKQSIRQLIERIEIKDGSQVSLVWLA
ncbi:recombinase family protein [Paenibacillus lautus]|uniref:Recombinase family protein n=1 Tax=Paenibacillus lautus TaxID=1401 RepID=A0A385U233_PAELA|nr:recombinase family protein [Paenibacillus lautus]AYB47675.1 recombinase family protein [Paenibacillus lautus]